MALSNRERVGRAFDYLSEGLYDLVDQVMTSAFGTTEWNDVWAREDAEYYGTPLRVYTKEDVQVQLRAITENVRGRGNIFREHFSHSGRSYASELRETRNKWAHTAAFDSDDAVRALDTIERLLRAANSNDSADDVKKIRLDVQRSVYEGQARRQVQRAAVKLDPGSGMKPWREVITPHEDVAGGGFSASEFAADLHLVHQGAATSPEYGDPVEFFNRTYLTEGLSDLLARALKRLSGDPGASPVVNLQTNFGGGKTHSMLALYHLFSGTPAADFPEDVQRLIAANGIPELHTLGVKRVALVGTYLQPGAPSVKADGTEVRTLWGELAWQLGGRPAYDIVAEADKTGTNPGDSLRLLFEQHGPALILIDEWVAYARQLVTDRELPAGSFETQFTFAQSLTEVVRGIPGIMLVVSIPASDASDAAAGSDVEIGGEKGKLALDRLQNVIRRVADQWRASSRDESFEIVRRRLFQAPDAAAMQQIEATAQSFIAMYRSEQSHYFPMHVRDDKYLKRIRDSYPLHPELLDRLYEDWSTLERFQRTRGVLKLVSSIVHELWAANDSSPLILPGNVPLSATPVNTDLTQYLEDQWKPIIDSDIDGDAATAARIDLEKTALGRRFLTQRAARTIFMGAAPRKHSSRKGLDKQFVWLGTAVPGDALGDFGTALELLSQRSTYFYEEQGHYWFDTQPSVTKTANDYAERLREDPETVWNEIVRRLNSVGQRSPAIARVHIAPATSGDIPDMEEVHLVVLHPRYARHKQGAGDAATMTWIHDAVEQHGASHRKYRNAVIFLMADASELEGLEAVTRSYLGWHSVDKAGDTYDLSKQQRKQAKDATERFSRSVDDRIRDAFVWAVYPEQSDPTKPFTLATTRITSSGGGSLADRVETRLTREGLLDTILAPSIVGATLHSELAQLWHTQGEITIGKLWELYASYPYMPRLANRSVLDDALERAFSQSVLEGENFAFASSKDETGKYRGITLLPTAESSQRIALNDNTLIIKANVAEEQFWADELERKQREASGSNGSDKLGPVDIVWPQPPGTKTPSGDEDLPAQARPTRYTGTSVITSDRYARELTLISQEVLARLKQEGVELRVTVEITATKEDGFDEGLCRTVRENAAQLKFTTSEFES